MNQFNNIFDIVDLGILKGALYQYAKVNLRDYQYLKRIKNLYNYIGFDIKDFDNITYCHSYVDLIKEFKQDERENTTI